MVSVVVTTIIENEVSIIKEMLGPYVDEFMIHDACNTLPKYSNEGCDREKSIYKEQSGRKKNDYSCSMVFDRIHITHNGFLTACCQDFNNDLLIADLKEVSLYDAWNGERFKRFREMHLTGKLKSTLCHGCLSGIYQPYAPLTL